MSNNAPSFAPTGKQVVTKEVTVTLMCEPSNPYDNLLPVNVDIPASYLSDSDIEAMQKSPSVIPKEVMGALHNKYGIQDKGHQDVLFRKTVNSTGSIMALFTTGVKEEYQMAYTKAYHAFLHDWATYCDEKVLRELLGLETK